MLVFVSLESLLLDWSEIITNVKWNYINYKRSRISNCEQISEQRALGWACALDGIRNWTTHAITFYYTLPMRLSIYFDMYGFYLIKTIHSAMKINCLF